MLWVLIIGVLWRVFVHMLYSDSYLERKIDHRLLIMISMSSCICCFIALPGSILWSVYCQQWFLLISGRLWWYENMIWKVYLFIIYIILTGERHCVGPMVAGLRACRHICWKSHSELFQYHQKTNNTVSRVLYNTAADDQRFFTLNEIMLYFWNIHWKQLK